MTTWVIIKRNLRFDGLITLTIYYIALSKVATLIGINTSA